jgi:hypothetical protein
MSTTVTKIGAFEAKTKFSELLSRVYEEAAKVVAEWRRRRKRCRLGGLRIKELINEGRR